MALFFPFPFFDLFSSATAEIFHFLLLGLSCPSLIPFEIPRLFAVQSKVDSSRLWRCPESTSITGERHSLYEYGFDGERWIDR
ncbi:hypothetical protein BS50DRAFT_129313 [Corynespora cassiicola Philippines]|uniref:Uncharacterized protein n=1 Tax=Corynespora cassiicola Philippines TaxID=1448308 RepID=A0A2T2NBJ3_CORCC|nr:hypothetical protein BS50DRAFT_129313 [Corynespora cassiicola Philippines]